MHAKRRQPMLLERLLNDWGVDIGAAVFLAGALLSMYLQN